MTERIMGWDCPTCKGRIAVAYEWDDELGISVVGGAELTPEIIVEAEMDDPDKPNCSCNWNAPNKGSELQNLINAIGLSLHQWAWWVIACSVRSGSNRHTGIMTRLYPNEPTTPSALSLPPQRRPPMLPDDVRECRRCGWPVRWSHTYCDRCEPKRCADCSRFVSQDTERCARCATRKEATDA